MLKIGLTGGIGSGKSYICNVFRGLGVCVYEADKEARRLMVEEEDLRSKISRLFGEKAYHDQELNSKYIAELVFRNNDLLSELNSIVHPAVHKDFLDWVNQQPDSTYVIKEAAILFETGGYKQMDKNILVIAEEQTRIERVIKRDGVSEADVRDRIAKQMNDIEKKKLADYVIYNEKDSMILQQIVDLHQNLMIN